MAFQHCAGAEQVRDATASLRLRHGEILKASRSGQQERVLRAFSALALLWQERLDSNWMPPADSAFPWPQVRLSLAALLPGLTNAKNWLARSAGPETPLRSTVVALVLAGNTPLLAWSPVSAALLAGNALFVKQSRDETVWTRLFVESLAEVDADLASLIHLDLWPGESPRTTALVTDADAVVAYGSDVTLAALRARVPDTTPFFGFGHAVSIGIVTEAGTEEAGRFARDILLYNQGGCLSAHALLVEQRSPHSAAAQTVAQNLAESLERECGALGIPSVTDPAAARSVRQARDMALFLGSDVSVLSDPGLRWTIVLRATPCPLDFPTGSGVVQVTPVERIKDHLHDQLGAMRGLLSSVGAAGALTNSETQALLAEGVSRLCRAGEMQMPPLDWPNGNRDLLAELLKIRSKAEIKTVDG